MNRIFTLLLVLIFIGQDSFAQQLPLFTQYREYHGYINPASLNSDYFTYSYNFSVGISHRQQWSGYEDGPSTQVIRGEYIHDSGGAFGLVTGGYLLNDKTDPMGFTGIYGRIAGLATSDPEWGGLSIGVSFGAVQYRVDASKFNARDRSDLLIQEDQSKIFPDVGVGVYFYKRMEGGFFDGDNFYAGLSIPQTLGLNLDYTNENGAFSTKRIQHFYGLLGWYKYINEDSFFELSSWTKYAPNAPLQADLNIRYQMSNFFWLGTGLSTSGGFHIEGGFLLGDNMGWTNNIKIGYGYDYNYRTFGPAFGHTHEINLSYTIDTRGSF